MDAEEEDENEGLNEEEVDSEDKGSLGEEDNTENACPDEEDDDEVKALFLPRESGTSEALQDLKLTSIAAPVALVFRRGFDVVSFPVPSSSRLV